MKMKIFLTEEQFSADLKTQSVHNYGHQTPPGTFNKLWWCDLSHLPASLKYFVL